MQILVCNGCLRGKVKKTNKRCMVGTLHWFIYRTEKEKNTQEDKMLRHEKDRNICILNDKGGMKESENRIHRVIVDKSPLSGLLRSKAAHRNCQSPLRFS